MTRRTLIFPLVSIALLGFASQGWAQQGPSSCTAAGQVRYVADVMTDLYYWYHEIPSVSPSRYASPEAYLDAVRYRPRDTSFSYITTQAANDAFYSDSQFIGYGLSTVTSDTEMRVLQVFDESPASEAALARGDRIVEINGRQRGNADLHRPHRHGVRPGRDRRAVRDSLSIAIGAGAAGDDDEAAGHDPDGVAVTRVHG